jgi:small subunit ribosomal protein S5
MSTDNPETPIVSAAPVADVIAPAPAAAPAAPAAEHGDRGGHGGGHGGARGGRGGQGGGGGGRGGHGGGGGGGGRGGQGAGGQGGRRRDRGPRDSEPASEYIDKVVDINRCAKVVKGGRRFSFSALVVAGDGKGRVGLGFGKAKEVPDAIKKGTERAHRRFRSIQLRGPTIPHEVLGMSDGGKVLLRPASPGTGVIAGGGVRAVLEAVGVNDVLTKSLGSNNPMAMVNATLDGLYKLRSASQIHAMRARQTN